MKKLMIAAAALLVGVAANAATYNWQAQSGWVSPDDENALEGAKVYFFDATKYTSAQFIAALEGGAGTEVFDNAFATTGTVNDGGEFNFFDAGITSYTSGDEYVSGWIALLAQDASGDDYAYVKEMNPVKVTDAIKSGDSAKFNFGDIVTGTVGGTGWTAVNVPEPTSGLLLLLGVAGLALRRRRA